MNKPIEYIADSPVWVDKVRQISPSDRVLGGTGEPAYWQAKGLSDRTTYLKAQQDSTTKSITKINSDLDKQDENIKAVDMKVKPITEGGTGATTATDARANLGLKSAATLDKTDNFGTSANLVATQLLVDKLQKEMNDAMPVGLIVCWDHAEAPKGWLFVRDQKFSATEYPELAKLYPSLTLNDRRGTVDRALDAGRGFDSGRVLGSYQEDAVKKTTGSVLINAGHGNAGLFASSPQGVFSRQESGHGKAPYITYTESAYESQNLLFDSSRVARTSYETRMKNVATNKIIKAK